jgi:tRNA pseudouridine38-40 synthase
VFDSKWEKTSKGLTYHVRANRFLQHMVRFLLGTMVEVGRGRMTLDDFKLFMDGGHPELAVVRAPAHGLYLAEVSYA